MKKFFIFILFAFTLAIQPLFATSVMGSRGFVQHDEATHRTADAAPSKTPSDSELQSRQGFTKAEVPPARPLSIAKKQSEQALQGSATTSHLKKKRSKAKVKRVKKHSTKAKKWFKNSAKKEGTGLFGKLALIFGILGFALPILGILFPLLALFIAGFIFGIAAIVFGAKGLSREKGRGLAISGLTLGIVSVLLFLLPVIIIIGYAFLQK